MRTVGLISLGCPKNLVDSEVMLGLLEKAGYRIVADPATADVLIVNTCGFIEDAKKESVDTILEMAGYKPLTPTLSHPSTSLRTGKGRGRGRCQKLVVTGCLPQRYKGELAKAMPEVDLFVGTGEYHKIVELLETSFGCHCEEPKRRRSNPVRSTGSPRPLRQPQGARDDTQPVFIHTSKTPRKLATAKHAVYVKIAEGCFHACSFCIIPKLRGAFRSREMNDIVAEAKDLIAGGAKELNLIAQDTTSYGRDLKDGSTLAKLLKKLGKIDGDFWIRIMYAYPTSVTDELISEIASNKKVCKYLDIPIQHISDKILKLMRRKESGKDVRDLVKKLKDKIPNLILRTSLIVGFPCETSADFKEILEFVKEGHFDHLGVFTYSKEEDTHAAKLPNQVPQKTKEKRQKEIMLVQKTVSKSLNNRYLSKTLKVLIDGTNLARTEGQAPEIDGVVRLKNAKGKMGEFALAKIVKTEEYDLVGVIARP